MNQLLTYSIFFIFFILTKEKIIYKNEDNYNYDNYCFEFKDILKLDLTTLSRSQIALNAQNCRLNDIKGNKEKDDPKCCYISLFKKPDWYYFCGLLPPENFDDIQQYIKDLKDEGNSNQIFDDLKIDCFSKKFGGMIITLIISLIYLF